MSVRRCRGCGVEIPERWSLCRRCYERWKARRLIWLDVLSLLRLRGSGVPEVE
jgi:hypothetical protein